MKIIVVRHASTNYNTKKLITGQFDDELAPEGLKELPELAKKLKAYDFTSIYSSPLKRALQTANAINESRHLDIKVDKRIMEVNFGSFTSKNWHELKDVFGLDSRALLDTYRYDLTPFGGESADQVRDRVQAFLNDLTKQPKETPLIVTHGGIIRWIHLLLTNEKTSWHPNSSVLVFNI